MPRIPDEYPKCAFYLYASKGDAEKNVNPCGTGFFVGVPDKNYPDYTLHLYAVTNWHVAVSSGATVLRVNLLRGGTGYVESDPSDWISDPNGHDVAILPLGTDKFPNKTFDYSYVQLKDFITKESLTEQDIGLGDDVFMIGLFVSHNGGYENIPTARFGNISMMPSLMKQGPSKNEKDAYCLDLHSRSGYSGSPVFVYRTPGSNLAKNFSKIDAEEKFLELGRSKLFFLGVHFAQFSEDWKIKDKNEYIEGLSGMTCVCPSWAILDLLEKNEHLVAHRSAEEEKTKKYFSANPVPKLEVNILPENNSHREDFNNLLDAAIRGKPSGD